MPLLYFNLFTPDESIENLVVAPNVIAATIFAEQKLTELQQSDPDLAWDEDRLRDYYVGIVRPAEPFSVPVIDENGNEVSTQQFQYVPL